MCIRDRQNTRLSALPLYFSDLASGCGLQTELDNALCRTEREIAGVTRREAVSYTHLDVYKRQLLNRFFK